LPFSKQVMVTKVEMPEPVIIPTLEETGAKLGEGM
jgi:hypothetical protein